MNPPPGRHSKELRISSLTPVWRFKEWQGNAVEKIRQPPLTQRVYAATIHSLIRPRMAALERRRGRSPRGNGIRRTPQLVQPQKSAGHLSIGARYRRFFHRDARPQNTYGDGNGKQSGPGYSKQTQSFLKRRSRGSQPGCTSHATRHSVENKAIGVRSKAAG
jgi:hypothetical protein